MPIRHIVLCRFRAEVPASAIEELIEKLAALGRVEGIRFSNFAAGENISPEDFSQGLHWGFSMDFANAADRDAYLAHPEHKNVGAALVASLDGGTNGLCGFDMTIAG